MHAKQFYRQCYQSTGGWLPMYPLKQTIRLGDFCQLRNGILRPLGNIKHLVEPGDTLVSPPMMLEPQDWVFHSGVESISQYLSGGCSVQELGFAEPSSFLFYLKQARAQFILNWQKIQQQITLKITQTDFGFRQLYVVSAVVAGTDWAFARSGQSEATWQLRVDTAIQNSSSYALLQDDSVQVDAMQGPGCLEKDSELPCYFFQAKKLVLAEQKKEQILQMLSERAGDQEDPYTAGWQQGDLMAYIPAQEISGANCLDYFTWRDFTLDDMATL